MTLLREDAEDAVEERERIDPFSGGPCITVATVCQDTILEMEGQLPVLRLKDTFTPPKVREAPYSINTRALISVRGFPGEDVIQTIQIRMDDPWGEELYAADYELEVGVLRGINLEARFPIPVVNDGVFRVVVSFHGRELTSILLHVTPQASNESETGSDPTQLDGPV